MLLDRINKKVKTFVNTDVFGSVDPSEFERFVHDAIQERNEDYFYDLNRIQLRANRGFIVGGMANLVDRYSEKILFYEQDTDPIEVVNGKVLIPDDVRYLYEPENYEFCKDRRTFNILKASATSKYPIYRISGNSLVVSPVPTTEAQMTFPYLRKIKYPKWTYNVISGVEMFNPDATDFVDADIHPSEENEIVRLVLMRFGVNLKEADITNYAMQNQTEEFKENNAT
jgi:hypothetical protein